MGRIQKKGGVSRITLTLAHLRIAYMVGNLEVGNSEYMGHQDCPPQLLCVFCTIHALYGPWVSAWNMSCVFHHNTNNLLMKFEFLMISSPNWELNHMLKFEFEFVHHAFSTAS